jgi:Protein phosphatase 2C
MIARSYQTGDNFVRRSPGETLSLRLLSLRCQEARMQDLPGQDYASIASNSDASAIAFCVCDGVGQSFKGDFAARYLAQRLVRWLRTLPAVPSMAEPVSSGLRLALESWAHDGQATLVRRRLPDEPPLLREVLAEVRETYGSETVFLGGRIDSQQLAVPLSRSAGARAIFCWMGNVTAQLYAADGQCIGLGDAGDDRNRWSTGRGIRGELTVRVMAAESMRRLIVYTDGIEPLAGDLASLTGDELQDQAWHLLASPTSDDMTVLDVELL